MAVSISKINSAKMLGSSARPRPSRGKGKGAGEGRGAVPSPKSSSAQQEPLPGRYGSQAKKRRRRLRAEARSLRMIHAGVSNGKKILIVGGSRYLKISSSKNVGSRWKQVPKNSHPPTLGAPHPSRGKPKQWLGSDPFSEQLRLARSAPASQ